MTLPNSITPLIQYRPPSPNSIVLDMFYCTSQSLSHNLPLKSGNSMQAMRFFIHAYFPKHVLYIISWMVATSFHSLLKFWEPIDLHIHYEGWKTSIENIVSIMKRLCPSPNVFQVEPHIQAYPYAQFHKHPTLSQVDPIGCFSYL